MSGIEISEEVTAAQLEALSGGELLRAEVIKQINLRLLKLIDSNWFQLMTLHKFRGILLNQEKGNVRNALNVAQSNVKATYIQK